MLVAVAIRVVGCTCAVADAIVAGGADVAAAANRATRAAIVDVRAQCLDFTAVDVFQIAVVVARRASDAAFVARAIGRAIGLAAYRRATVTVVDVAGEICLATVRRIVVAIAEIVFTFANIAANGVDAHLIGGTGENALGAFIDVATSKAVARVTRLAGAAYRLWTRGALAIDAAADATFAHMRPRRHRLACNRCCRCKPQYC